MIVGGDDEIDRNIEIQSAPSFSIIDQRVEMRVQVNDPTAERVQVGVTINGEAQPDQTVHGRRAADDRVHPDASAARTLSCCQSTAFRTS